MERGRFFVKKRDIVLGSLMAVSLSAGIQTAGAKTPSKPKIYPESAFRSIEIPEDDPRMDENYIAYSNNLKIEIPSPAPLAKQETRRPNLFKDVKPEINWKQDPEISWYGPNFYGKRTACGQELTKELKGVANRDLPCGTLVTFKFKDKQITVPVVDRGPYVDGRIFDLTGGACVALEHCFTGPINYSIDK